jgi:hypothetical protein
MAIEARVLSYRSDRLVKGRLLTRQVDPSQRDLPAKLRPWLGPAVEVELREEYRRYQCKVCGRVDERKCFRQGLPGDFVVPPPRPDLHVTDEYFDVWSRRLADAVVKVAGDLVELYPLPGDEGYVVPWPKRLIDPPKHIRKLTRDFAKPRPRDLGFRVFADPCRRCGRHQSVTQWAEYYDVPKDLVIAALSIDTEDYPCLFRHLRWVVGPHVAAHLRKGKLRNVAIGDDFNKPRRDIQSQLPAPSR